MPEVIIEYAIGLMNLTNKQEAADAVKTIEQLKTLMDTHKDIPEIVSCYEEGLLNLFQKQ